MDSIASPPTPATADGPTPAIAGSVAPLVYAEDVIEGGRWWGGGALAGQWRCQGVGVGVLLSEEGGGRDNQH